MKRYYLVLLIYNKHFRYFVINLKYTISKLNRQTSKTN